MEEILKIELRINVLSIYEYGYDQENKEDYVISHLKDHHTDLGIIIEERVKKIFGYNYSLDKFNIKKGSIEILIYIGAAGVIYTTISQYKSFRESIPLIKSDIETIFSTFFKLNRIEAEIDSRITPLAEIPKTGRLTLLMNSYPYLLLILIIYLFISNILMLILLFGK